MPKGDKRVPLRPMDVVEAQVDAFMARLNTQRGVFKTGEWRLYLAGQWIAVDLPEIEIPMDERARDYMRESILAAARRQIIS